MNFSSVKLKKQFVLRKVTLLGLLGFFVSLNALGATATGKINNVAWTFVSGKAKLEGDNVKITLWNESFADTCNEWTGSVFDVRAVFPGKVGNYNVDPNGFTQNVIIMGDGRVPGSPDNNIFASTGFMNITEMTDTEVKGTFSATNTWKKSDVKGDFTVPLCSSDDN